MYYFRVFWLDFILKKNLLFVIFVKQSPKEVSEGFIQRQRPKMSSRRKRGIRPSSAASSFSISPSSSSSSDFNDNEITAMPQRQQRAPPRLRRPSRLPANIFVVIIATIGAFFHCCHVARLHENHLSFAYLSNAERELTFRSEMAFYYSFYKQVCSNCFILGEFLRYFS